MANRYRASERTEHSCCWAASVEDTCSPTMINGEHYKGQYTLICECESLLVAEEIAAALNAMLPP